MISLYLYLSEPHDTGLTCATRLRLATRAVLAELADGPASTKALARRTGCARDTVRFALREWRR